MSFRLEIKYFNSFVIRKTIASVAGDAVWAGDPSNPKFYPAFPVEADGLNSNVIAYDWFAEESRIRGEFNGDEVNLGVRAYLANEEKNFDRRPSTIIWSGIYNSANGVNNSNVFSIAEQITKAVDPRYGGIEWMYADDSNLTIYQELKVSKALIDRDAIYSQSAGAISTRSDQVMGDIQYYSMDSGIGKFPESFAVSSTRQYYADVPNASINRKSVDGMTEISRYGMFGFFRDELSRLSSIPKRFIVDVGWTIPWVGAYGDVDELTVSGDNIGEINIGMAIEGIIGWSDLYVTSIGTPSGGEVVIGISKTIRVLASPQSSVINLVKYVKDRVVGGFDSNKELYNVSLVYNEPSRLATGLDVVDLDEGTFVPTPS